jgi:hypothetical protein
MTTNRGRVIPEPRMEAGMAKAVEITVHVADLHEFLKFVAAARDVVREYDAARSGGSGTDLGIAIEAMSAEMRCLVADNT